MLFLMPSQRTEGTTWVMQCGWKSYKQSGICQEISQSLKNGHWSVCCCTFIFSVTCSAMIMHMHRVSSRWWSLLYTDTILGICWGQLLILTYCYWNWLRNCCFEQLLWSATWWSLEAHWINIIFAIFCSVWFFYDYRIDDGSEVLI